MNFVGRCITHAKNFYSQFNHSTLSGASDIIVVRDENNNILGSTPFYVRFGSLGLLRPKKHKVFFVLKLFILQFKPKFHKFELFCLIGPCFYSFRSQISFAPCSPRLNFAENI